MTTTREKILSFKNLEEGWCFTEGGPLQGNVIDRALSLLEAVDEAFKTDAFPGLNGEIELSIVKGIRSLDVIIESDERCTAICEIYDKELFYKENLSVDQVREEVINFCKRK